MKTLRRLIHIILCVTVCALAVSFLSSCIVKDIVYKHDLDNENDIRRLSTFSFSAAGFAENLFDRKNYNVTVMTGNGLTSIDASKNPLMYARLKGLYTIYCEVKGGELVDRYVPQGFDPVITDGFATQEVFTHKSPMGRTEFAWCLAGNKAVFAMAPTGETGKSASGYYIMEDTPLEEYRGLQIKKVTDYATQAAQTLAYFKETEIQETRLDTLTSVQLNISTINPQLFASFYNDTRYAKEIDLATPAGLLVDSRRYLFIPAQAGNNILAVTVREDDCILDHGRFNLTVPARKTCTIRLVYQQDSRLEGLPSDRATFFFAGQAIVVQPVNELESGSSNLWLKPRLDRDNR